MKMKKACLSTLGALALVPAIAGATTTSYFPGHMCQRNDTAVQYNDNGIQNLDNFSHGIYCPASWTSSAANGQANAPVSISAATLIYTDTSSGSFQCHVEEENWDGSVQSSWTLSSCSTFGGCTTDSNSSLQGQGQLNWTTPIEGGATLYPTSVLIHCSIPGSGSIVRGYNVSLR